MKGFLVALLFALTLAGTAAAQYDPSEGYGDVVYPAAHTSNPGLDLVVGLMFVWGLGWVVKESLKDIGKGDYKPEPPRYDAATWRYIEEQKAKQQAIKQTKNGERIRIDAAECPKCGELDDLVKHIREANPCPECATWYKAC